MAWFDKLGRLGGGHDYAYTSSSGKKMTMSASDYKAMKGGK